MINTSRGAVVCEDDLYFALKQKFIAGAASDVFENEPLAENSGLWERKNVVITPHNSFVSSKNNARLFNLAYGNIKTLMKGLV